MVTRNDDPFKRRLLGDELPQVTMDCPDVNSIVQLTSENIEGHVILAEHGLEMPVEELLIMVEGSSHEEGVFGFKTTLRITSSEEDDERPDNFVDNFVEDFQGEPLDEDGELYLLTVNGEIPYQYILSIYEDHSLFTLETAGTTDPSLNIAQRALRDLRHGEHSPKDAFFNFISLSEHFLDTLYQAYDQNNLRIPLTLSPEVQAEPETADSEIKALPTEKETDELKLEDFVGAEAAVKKLMKPILLLQHPDLREAYNLKRPPSGIVIYGPPGVGKTSMAKAVAAKVGAKVRTVKSSDIYNMYIGNSEQNMQAILDEARKATEPLVLLFDEIDGIIKPQSNSATHNSVYTLLKQQIGELSRENPNVIVIATTNKNPAEIDEALFRKERFDTHIYVPLPNEDARNDLFAMVIVRFSARAKREIFDLENIDCRELARATEDLSHADITAVISGAVEGMLVEEALTKQRPAPLTTRDLLEAIRELRTS